MMHGVPLYENTASLYCKVGALGAPEESQNTLLAVNWKMHAQRINTAYYMYML